jgi:hypothetical protein
MVVWMSLCPSSRWRVWRWLTPPAPGRMLAIVGQRSGGWQAEEMVESDLHGVWGWVTVRLMTGKVASAARSCWPIIPKWGDRQVFLITCYDTHRLPQRSLARPGGGSV